MIALPFRNGASMKRQKLRPVIVKQRAKQQAFVLISRGYVQARETVDCPVCSLRFLLLFDRKDRNTLGGKSTDVHLDAVEYFLVKVKEDHRKGHPHDKFAMPGFVRHRDVETNLVESCCVLCGKQIGESREEPKLAHAERVHNCSLSVLRAATFN
jgi:hypothetical protein